MTRGRPLSLGAITMIRGRLTDGTTCDLTDALAAPRAKEAGPTEPTPSPFQALTGIEMKLDWRGSGKERPTLDRSPRGKRPRLAGFVWDLPAEMGRRLTAVRVGTESTPPVPWRWRCDPQGRIVVSLRWIGRERPTRVECDLAAPPADQRHLGQIWPNVIIATHITQVPRSRETSSRFRC